MLKIFLIKTIVKLFTKGTTIRLCYNVLTKTKILSFALFKRYILIFFINFAKLFYSIKIFFINLIYCLKIVDVAKPI